MNDPLNHNGKIISGGAARQVRAAQQGGITNICQQVAQNAVNHAIQNLIQQLNQSTQLPPVIVESPSSRPS